MGRNRVVGSPFQPSVVTSDTTTQYRVDQYLVDAPLGSPVTLTLDPGAVQGDQVAIQDVGGNAEAQPIVINASPNQTLVNIGETISITTNGGSVQLTYDATLQGWVVQVLGQGASRSAAPGTPPYNPAWYALLAIFWDPDNSTGLASDENSGASALLPVLTFAEIVQRYGSTTPALVYGQSLVINQMSAQPSASADRWSFSPVCTGGGTSTLDCTMIVAGSGTNGTVVALNMATPQQWTINLGQAAGPFVGMIYEDTVAGGWGVIHAASGDVATITQPFTDPTASRQAIITTPTMVTPVSGHAYTIWKPCATNCDVYEPLTTEYPLSPEAVAFSAMYNAAIAKPAGGTFTQVRIGHGVYMGNCVFNAELFLDVDGTQSDFRRQFVNCWFPANDNLFSDCVVLGGGVPTTCTYLSFGGATTLDGNVYVDSTGTVITVGGHVFLALVEVGPGVTFNLGYSEGSPADGFGGVNLYGSTAIWGAGGFAVSGRCAIRLDGVTAVNYFLQKGGLTLNDATDAFSVTLATPAVWNWIPLTPTAIDAAAGASGFGGAAYGQYGAKIVKGA